MLNTYQHVQALSEAPGAAAGNGSAAGASGMSGSKLGGGVKAMLGSLLPERGAWSGLHCREDVFLSAGQPAVDISGPCSATCQSICGAAARPAGACLLCRT